MDILKPKVELIPLLGITGFAVGVLALAIAYTPPAPSNEDIAAVVAADVFALTNGERRDGNVSVLARNALLDSAAQMKAEDMAAKGYYAHVSPEGITPMHWVEKAGYKYLIVGENLVVNRADAEQVVDAFMGSPGHRANILRKDFTEMGVGVANGTYKGKRATFAVQIFAAPYPKPSSPKPTTVASASVKPAAAPKKPIAAPAATKAPIVTIVPRTPPEGVRSTSSETDATTTPVRGPLPEELKELIDPLFSPAQENETSATSTPTTTPIRIPSYFLSDISPIELAGVSRLETLTPPLPLGSAWSMQFQLFIDTLVGKTRNFFPS